MKWLETNVRLMPLRTRSIIAISFALGLSGCHSNISRVKDMKLDADPSLTIGQAFDNRKICRSVEWKEFTDEQKRKVVEYACTMNGVDEAVAAYRKKKVQDLIHDMENQEGFKCLNPIDAAKQDLERDDFTLQHYKELMESAKNDTPDRAAAEEKDLTSRIESIANEIDQGKARLDSLENVKSSCIASIEKDFKPRIENPMPGATKSIDEVFQWAVSNDGDVTSLFAGYRPTSLTGETRNISYGSAVPVIIEVIARNTASTYTEYQQQIAAQGFSDALRN